MDGGLVVVVVVVVGCLPFRTEDEKGHGVTVEARMKIVWAGWREWEGPKIQNKKQSLEWASEDSGVSLQRELRAMIISDLLIGMHIDQGRPVGSSPRRCLCIKQLVSGCLEVLVLHELAYRGILLFSCTVLHTPSTYGAVLCALLLTLWHTQATG